MTDYNDGEWYGWNGGECPVHPKSMVQCRLFCSSNLHDDGQDLAREWDFDTKGRPTSVIAFRVITPYVEARKPREMWLVGAHAFTSKDMAEQFQRKLAAEYGDKFLDAEWTPVLYREVLE